MSDNKDINKKSNDKKSNGKHVKESQDKSKKVKQDKKTKPNTSKNRAKQKKDQKSQNKVDKNKKNTSKESTSRKNASKGNTSNKKQTNKKDKNQDTKVNTNKKRKTTKAKRQEELVNPFKTEKSFLDENEKIQDYESKSKIEEDILNAATPTTKDNYFLIFVICFIAIGMFCIYYIFNIPVNKSSGSQPIEIEEYTYVAPFTLKANQTISDTTLKNMLKGNSKIFRYMALVKDKSTTTLSDIEKINMVCYMLFYSNNEEFEQNAICGYDNTYYQVNVKYLDKYIQSMFKGEVDYAALGIGDYYEFDNNLFFSEPTINIVRKEYDKDLKRNVLALELVDNKTGRKTYLTLYYLLEDKNFYIYEMSVQSQYDLLDE